MFLKRSRPNKRILFNNYFVDLWGKITAKRKFKNRTTQRFLQFFGRYVSNELTSSFAFKKFRESWARRSRLKKINLSAVKKAGAERKFILINRSKETPSYKKFILRRLKNSMKYRAAATSFSTRYWSAFFKRSKVTKFMRRYVRWRPYPKKRFWLKRKKDYAVAQLMDLVFQQYHYGFGTLSSFRAYLKRFAIRGYGVGPKNLGLEGMLANLICRTSITPEIRFAYILVRSGGVCVNNICVKNPRAILSVGDTIALIPPFLKFMLNYYLIRLKKKKVAHSIAPFFEYNLRLMKFRVWRKPTQREWRLLTYYPFFKNELNWGPAKYLEWEI